MNCTPSNNPARREGSAPNPRPLDARTALKRAAVAGLGLATISASFLYAPFVQHGPILCPFRLLTGLPCPSCGLTRSFCAMSHGHIANAFVQHWMGPPLFAATILAVPILATQALTRRRMRWMDEMMRSKATGWLVALGMIGFQCHRLASMAIAGQIKLAMHASLMVTLAHGVRRFL